MLQCESSNQSIRQEEAKIFQHQQNAGLEEIRSTSLVKLPPIRPSCKLKNNEKREAARAWRRKKILNGAKTSTGKSVSGKERPQKIEEKPKLKKEPVPMRKRALPESFWHEPDSLKTSSLAGSFFSTLPPLFSSDTNNNEDLIEIRPATPPGEKSFAQRSEKSRYMTAPPDTDLLFSLFDPFENKIDKSRLVRRGRPKKLPNENSAHTTVQKHEDDPCMVKSLTEKLFPQLSLGGETPTNIAPKFAVLKLPTGEKTIELPAIQVAKNYSSILTELVSHM